MQQQAFREETDAAPRYDSETVRRALARASELETQPEPDALTPVQVETLGAELGLHPDAVRRALSEVVAPAVAAEMVTQEDLKNVYLPTAVLLFLSFPAALFVFMALGGGGFALIGILSLLFVLRTGWQAKQYR